MHKAEEEIFVSLVDVKWQLDQQYCKQLLSLGSELLVLHQVAALS